MKKTKIICSIGPASSDIDVMEKMILAGMNVARINFTHAPIEQRNAVVAAIRSVRKKTDKNIAIMWDTKGPEFRGGEVSNNGINLVEGKTIRIVNDNCLGTEEKISVNHPNILKDFSIGTEILLENGKMKLKVLSKEEYGITCEIIAGGVLGSHKSFSVPGVKLNIPYISEADLEDIEYACKTGGEFLAISFVSSKDNVLEVKELLRKYNREDLQIICKIESALGIENLDEILEECDGIMIARGDLGTEILSERLPIIQKEIIKKCRAKGKICVVATEMLETMMEENRPKRAETSDIANAVIDGTDAVMLSGETTVGKHPVETVEAMARICETTEMYTSFDYIAEKQAITSVPMAICESVVESANRLGAKVICATTISGATARTISNLKPNALILALCPDLKMGRRLALNWGVYTKEIPYLDSTDEILTESIKKAKEFVPLNTNDIIITTGAFPNSKEATPTNLLKIEQIKE